MPVLIETTTTNGKTVVGCRLQMRLVMHVNRSSVEYAYSRLESVKWVMEVAVLSFDEMDLMIIHQVWSLVTTQWPIICR